MKNLRSEMDFFFRFLKGNDIDSLQQDFFVQEIKDHFDYCKNYFKILIQKFTDVNFCNKDKIKY